MNVFSEVEASMVLPVVGAADAFCAPAVNTFSGRESS
jgi:hypothetical protein